MENTYEALKTILRETLAGSRYDLNRLNSIKADSEFNEFAIDSLDMTEFLLRVQDEFGLTISRRDFSGLTSIAHVNDYIERHVNVEGDVATAS